MEKTEKYEKKTLMEMIQTKSKVNNKITMKSESRGIMKNIINKEATVNEKEIDVLKKKFPSCFDKNGNFNIEKFQNIINDETNIVRESYSLNWLGKSYARLLANTPVSTMLIEDIEHNSKPENINSNNLYIEGDNLEILKHMSNAYSEKIKMIYIDPPYNTGTDFIYQDDRKFTPTELAKMANVSLEEAKRILEFTNSKSNSHSAWLTFMYPRLYIARELLNEYGMIYISIDDNEVSQLKILCDEIFGEANFNGQLTVETAGGVFGKRASGLNNTFVKVKDYVLSYSKNSSLNDLKPLYSPAKSRFDTHYNKIKIGDCEFSSLTEYIKNNRRLSSFFEKYNLTINLSNIGKIMELNVEFNKIILEEYSHKIYQDVDYSLKIPAELEEKLKKGEIIYFKNRYIFRTRGGIGNTRYYAPLSESLKFTNSYSSEHRTAIAIGDLWKGFDEDMKNVNSEGIGFFDTPKPVRLIKQLIVTSNINDEDIVLDFFSGSSTTAHSILELNANTKNKIKFIMIQLPELIDAKKNKDAYAFCIQNGLPPVISSIAKERIKKASKKLQDQYNDSEYIDGVDFGFKVFKTGELENSSYLDELDHFDESVENLIESDTLTVEELYSLALTWKTHDGVPLTKPFETVLIDSYKGLLVNNRLYLMDTGFETKTLHEILRLNDEDDDFLVNSIVIYGPNFISKHCKEIKESIMQNNKKSVSIELEIRY